MMMRVHCSMWRSDFGENSMGKFSLKLSSNKILPEGSVFLFKTTLITRHSMHTTFLIITLLHESTVLSHQSSLIGGIGIIPGACPGFLSFFFFFFLIFFFFFFLVGECMLLPTELLNARKSNVLTC